MAYIETSIGIGFVAGPAFGTFIYSLIGFSGTFFITGSLFMIASPTFYYKVPRNQDSAEDLEE